MTVEEKREAMIIACGRMGVCTNCPLWDDTYDCDFTDDGFVTEFYDKLCSKVDHPAHYNQGTIECIDAMVAAYGKEAVKYFCLCNAFKYIWRTNNKNGIEDIDKAIWYLHKYKELSVNE